MNNNKKNTNITWSLDEIMSDRFGRYSKYIIQERALPDARDGLKPVQRRILYAMNEAGNTYDKPHRKSAKTVGIVIGTYHPHGDISVYDAMVRMSQDWKMNLPLIDMNGNNGGIDDDPAAAMRYTEARLSPYASLLLEDIDKETVIMTNNYDDSELEPTVLPAKFPLLLVNGATGIASGYATNIAPHNLKEVIEATIYRIFHPDCSVDDLMVFVKGPDFPTGGIVQGIDSIKEVFSTGKGKVIVKSKCEIINTKTVNQIVVTEIPYEVIKKNLVKKIDDIRLDKQIDGIVDVRDESGRDGLKIVIDVKKDIDASLVLNYLYKNTDLQINYNYNMIAIVNHAPVLMTLTTAIDAFINHRREVVLNASRYLRDKKKARIHILDGLIKAISILDEVIEIIRASSDKSDAKNRLKDAFLFSDEQAEAIVMMRLYRLSNTDIKTLKEEYAILIDEISQLEAIISSNDLLNRHIVDELKDVSAKYGRDRKTLIEDKVTDIVIDKMSMVTSEQVYISVSRDGYIKRYSSRVYQSNEGTLPYFKEHDKLLGVRSCNTLDTLLLITSKGNYAYLPIYKLEESKWKELGHHLSHYIKSDDEEKIVSALVVKNFDSYAYIFTVTAKGMIKKTLLPLWNVTRFSKVMQAHKLRKDDEVRKAFVAYHGDNILLVSKNGYYNYYKQEEIAPLAIKAQGVWGIDLKDDDELIDATTINEASDAIMLTSQRGNFKRIHISELAYTKRRTKGNRLYKQTKTNPQYAHSVAIINAYDNIKVYDGELKILAVKDIPFMDCDATFSAPLKLQNEFFILNSNNEDIKEVEIVDFPQDFSIEEDGNKQTTLF